MDPGVRLQALLSGLAAGAVLALVALGFTLVAGTVRVLHLAHGDVVVASVLTAVLAVLGTTPVALQPALGPALALVVLTLGAGLLLSVAVALRAVRPWLPDATKDRPGDPLGWLAGGVAAGLLLREGLGLLLPSATVVVPDPLRLASLSPRLTLPGGAALPERTLAVLALGLVVGLAVERLLAVTGLGRALRAVADDPEAAVLCGVPARRVVLQVFALAGLLDAPGRTSLSVDDGVVLGLSGIAAALLGGLGSVRGALAGGLAVGLLQAFVVALAGARWTDVAPLALLVVVLAVRPEGLRAQPAPA